MQLVVNSFKHFLMVIVVMLLALPLIMAIPPVRELVQNVVRILLS